MRVHIENRSLQFVHVDEVTLHLHCINVVADFNVQFSEVCFAFPACNASVQNVTDTHIKVMLQIEHSLLPVSIFLEGTRAEKYWSGQVAERCIEPRDQTMNSVSVVHIQLICGSELNIFLLAIDQVQR